MKRINLAYGRGSVSFAFDENRYQVLTSDTHDEKPLTDAEIGAALDSPIESLPLAETLVPGNSVLIVVSDATRATASAAIVNLLVRRIIQNGIAQHDIAIIFGTGIHRGVTKEEKLELLTPFIVQRVRIIDHDAFDSTQFEVVGEAHNGSPVELNRALTKFSHVIITGAIGFHYFAGFTGGRKSICPGLASASTIAATHMLALDFARGGRRAGVRTGVLAGNAVHEECERIAALIKPSFSVNSVVDERGRAIRIYAGDWRLAHEAGCREYLANHSVRIEQKREVVIVSCGGSPYDINLIQAHKALDMAANACNEGGTIVLLADCGDGLGRPDFLKWFDEKDSSALEARLREAYEVNGQTAWALLSKTERHKIVLISKLAPDDDRRMRMIPALTLDEALAQRDLDGRGYVLPRGAALMPLIKG
jgi:nickel-dependent lactate racemase